MANIYNTYYCKLCDKKYWLEIHLFIFICMAALDFFLHLVLFGFHTFKCY